MPDYTATRAIIGHLEKGADLYNSILRVLQENSVRVGRVTGMGAVQRAQLAYYDQQAMKYCNLDFNEAMEIVSLHGNISMKEGKPFAHVHVVLSNERGECKGGHLLPGGTPVFACELMIEEFTGPELVRNADPTTGLALWPKDRVL
jgi:predicted DNA-binding protein with PD1-like motif